MEATLSWLQFFESNLTPRFTLYQNVELGRRNPARLQLYLETEQQSENELVLFVETPCSVTEDGVGQIVDDVADALGWDRRLRRPGR